MLPDALNRTPGRQEVKRLTGNTWVPVLVTDDEAVIQGSGEIESWAQANPVGSTGASGGATASGGPSASGG
jgi:hypothetical protein